MLHAGEPFRGRHRALMGQLGIEWYLLDPDAVAMPLLDEAREVWAWRTQMEYRSVQVMTRFLSELLGAGAAVEVQACAAEAIGEEIRHATLCMSVVECLGHQPLLPTPLPEELGADFLALPMQERALVTGISMMLIHETFSAALIGDLLARATHPTIKTVLKALMANEGTYQQFGWAYVATTLRQVSPGARRYAAEVADWVLRGHLEPARELARSLPAAQQHLTAWMEPDRARLGLMSAEREALIKLQLQHRFLGPRLAGIGLL